ncbi:hypothetical protein K461DRAFT_325871 [Myriangium duriaei CBS 260.36]|uniref:SET domain-containing protein n=1 Tax=Myriangium duriaei CBS 260.36 TaxID=1168546 RepID=A0A9P4MSF9_9PEZI|nr:hypothetical protein K461DRAFT_325871 [Myriangium duriaei CBS 260.36]
MMKSTTPHVTNAPAPPPDAPTDPSVAAKTPQGAYPLSLNGLEDLVSYHHHAAGLSIVSRVALPAGAVFTPVSTATPALTKRWSTVQTGANSHIELNSALLYMNHSCAPSLEIDTKAGVVRVARNRDLKVGDDLTFFYPSTEWEFDNPFECLCRSSDCLHDIKGAKFLSHEELGKRFTNEHILDLAKERDA